MLSALLNTHKFASDILHHGDQMANIITMTLRKSPGFDSSRFCHAFRFRNNLPIGGEHGTESQFDVYGSRGGGPAGGGLVTLALRS